MNKQTIELLQFVVLCISVGTTIFVTISWYSSVVRKQYAAQRDFDHLKRNYEQLSLGQAEIMKEFDKRTDEIALDLRDLKNIANGIMLKISTDASIGWGKRES